MSLLIKSKFYSQSIDIANDYSESNFVKQKKEINKSGTLYRKGDKLTYKLVGALNTTDNSKDKTDILPLNNNELVNLINIEKKEGGNFEIDCGSWSKNLVELTDQNATYLLYKGFIIDNIFKDFHQFHIVTQGDIIKVGKIYLKILQIQLNNRNTKILRTSSDKEESINNSKSIFTEENDKVSNNENQNSCAVKQNLIPERESNNNIYKDNNKIIKILKYNSQISRKNIRNLINNINVNYSMIMTQKLNLTQLTIDINSVDDSNIKNLKQGKLRRKLFNKNHNNKDNFLDNNELINPVQKNEIRNKICRVCLSPETNSSTNPLISPCICKGSMKYIHYLCLKNWLNLKIESETGILNNLEEPITITYCIDDLCCELCKSQFPDYVRHNRKIYNINFYKPKYSQFLVFESVRNDRYRKRFIHIVPFNKDAMLRIGRYNNCELSFLDPSLSRIHCCIYMESNHLVMDNNSRYGTKVLIQKQKLRMVYNYPLCIETNNTYLKIILLKKFNFLFCCDCSTKSPYEKDPYQIQNQKGFDLFGSMNIIDDEEKNSENENNTEDKKDENINLINDVESDKEVNVKNENEIKNKKEENYINNIQDVKTIDENIDDKKEIKNLISMNLDDQLNSDEITNLKNNKKDITIISPNLGNKFISNNSQVGENLIYKDTKKEKERKNISGMKKKKLILDNDDYHLDSIKLNNNKKMDIMNNVNGFKLNKMQNKEKFNKIVNNLFCNINNNISRINNRETEVPNDNLNKQVFNPNINANIIENNNSDNEEENNINELYKSLKAQKISNISLKKFSNILKSKTNISYINNFKSIVPLIRNEQNNNSLLFAPKHNNNIKLGNYSLQNKNENSINNKHKNQ